MQHYTNQKEYRLIGMSRSGNHAIINWLLSHFNDRYCFLNCAEPGYNPYISARPMDDGRCAVASYREFDLAAEQEGRLSTKESLLYSYEDVFLGTVARGDSEHDAWVGLSAERVDVLILRDPFNLFASRRKAGIDEYASPSTSLRIWKQHAREALQPRRLPYGPIVILYNEWVTDRHYRARIAERLRLGFSDRGIDSVPGCLGGSSFDGMTYNGRASAMRVTERWRHYQYDSDYVALFDSEILALSEVIFGEIPGTRALAQAAVDLAG